MLLLAIILNFFTFTGLGILSEKVVSGKSLTFNTEKVNENIFSSFQYFIQVDHQWLHAVSHLPADSQHLHHTQGKSERN